MPHETIWEKSGVHWRFFENVSFDEIIDSSTEAYGYPRIHRMNYQIVNFLNITSLKWTKVQIEEVAAMDQAASMTNPNVKIAVVATQQQAMEIAAAYSAAAVESPWETEIFYNLGDARQWLNA